MYAIGIRQSKSARSLRLQFLCVTAVFFLLHQQLNVVGRGKVPAQRFSTHCGDWVVLLLTMYVFSALIPTRKNVPMFTVVLLLLLRSFSLHGNCEITSENRLQNRNKRCAPATMIWRTSSRAPPLLGEKTWFSYRTAFLGLYWKSTGLPRTHRFAA